MCVLTTLQKERQTDRQRLWVRECFKNVKQSPSWGSQNCYWFIDRLMKPLQSIILILSPPCLYVSAGSPDITSDPLSLPAVSHSYIFLSWKERRPGLEFANMALHSGQVTLPHWDLATPDAGITHSLPCLPSRTGVGSKCGSFVQCKLLSIEGCAMATQHSRDGLCQLGKRW
jgi:hypothetical protein